MGLVFGILRALVRAPVRAWRRIARIVPAMPDAPSGFLPRSKYRIGFLRTLAAPRWRTAARRTTIVLGFAVYFGVQLLLAFAIKEIDVSPLSWVLIVAFFIVTASFVLAAAKPTFAFIAWLVLSPLGFLFLRMDFGAGVPAITFDRIVLLTMATILIARTLVERRRIRAPIVGEWLILGFIGYTVLEVAAFGGGMSLKAFLGIISERFDHIALAVVVYYIAKSVLVTRKQLEWAIIGLVITGVYVAISAYYEHFTGNMWFSSFLGSDFRLMQEDVGMGRASGPLLNPAATGTFLGITAFLTFHLGVASRSRFVKFCCVCGTCAQLLGMLLYVYQERVHCSGSVAHPAAVCDEAISEAIRPVRSDSRCCRRHPHADPALRSQHQQANVARGDHSDEGGRGQGYAERHSAQSVVRRGPGRD